MSLLLLAIVLGAPATARAQTPPPAGGLDLNPVLQLVCDLTALLCPPAPATGIPAPPAAPPAPSDASPQSPGPPLPLGRIPDVASFPIPAASIPAAPAGVAIPPPAPAIEPGAPPPATELPPETARRVEPAKSAGVAPGSAPSASLELPRPDEVDLSARTVVVAAAVSIFGLILIGFPAELFNKTLRENYDRVRRRFPRLASPKSPPVPARQLFALVASAAVAGMLAALQKVGRGWSPASLATVALAVGLGFLLTTAVYEAAAAAANDRLGMPRRTFRTYPAGLPVVAAFVAISTLGQLQPPYLYGHLAGSRLEAKHNTGSRGPAIQTVISCTSLLAFGLLCWALRAAVTAAPWTDILAGVTVVALNRLVFSLIPVTFLDGNTVFRHSRGLWAGVYSASVLAFLLLVILPATRRAPSSAIGSAVVPFVIFVALSIGVWAFFRRSARSSVQPA